MFHAKGASLEHLYSLTNISQFLLLLFLLLYTCTYVLSPMRSPGSINLINYNCYRNVHLCKKGTSNEINTTYKDDVCRSFSEN